jgi:cytochrome P450
VSSSAATANTRDSFAVGTRVILPSLALGPVKRRPRWSWLAERLQIDRSAIRLLQRLRAEYGAGPLRLRVPGRSVAILLASDDVGRLLADSPETFTPASAEKNLMLGRFQPHGVLRSEGVERERRRHFNEAVLEIHEPVHSMAEPMLAAIAEECLTLADSATRRGVLGWDAFEDAWWRIVRTIVFGDRARDDDELIALLDALRRSANWVVTWRPRERLREAFYERLQRHLDRAEPGSLGTAARAYPGHEDVRPADQVAHWLFAYDAAGLAAMRALALLAVHPVHAALGREESKSLDRPQRLPHLRSCALESLRLWPTTPLLVRDSTEESWWGEHRLPEGTAFVVYAPLFHRDDQAVSYAHRFAPRIWRDGTAATNPGLVPFSGGPARCPGRDLVLFTMSTVLARLLDRHAWDLVSANPIRADRQMPATLDNFSLRFRPRRMA